MTLLSSRGLGVYLEEGFREVMVGQLSGQERDDEVLDAMPQLIFLRCLGLEHPRPSGKY